MTKKEKSVQKKSQPSTSANEWYVYIIKTINNKLYTGITTDLQRRFDEHKNLKTGAKFLKANPPKEIVYTETVDSKSSALKREIEIKKLSRKEKDRLIKA